MTKSVAVVLGILIITSVFILVSRNDTDSVYSDLTGEVLTGEVLTGEVLTGEVLTGEVLTGEVLTGEAILNDDTLSSNPSLYYYLRADAAGLIQDFSQPKQRLPFALSVENNVVMHEYLHNNQSKVQLHGATGGYIMVITSEPVKTKRGFFLAIGGVTKGNIALNNAIIEGGSSAYVYDLDNLIVNGYKMDIIKRYGKS